MAIKLADTIKPMGDFPIVEAKDVIMDNGETVEDVVSKISNDEGSLVFVYVDFGNLGNYVLHPQNRPIFSIYWEFNKQVNSIIIKLGNTEIAQLNPDARSYTFDSKEHGVQSNTTLTIIASNDEDTVEKSVRLKYGIPIYYGAATEPDRYTSDFISGFNKRYVENYDHYVNSDKWLDDYQCDMNVAEGQYGYWAVPYSTGLHYCMYKIQVNGMLADTFQNAISIYIPDEQTGINTEYVIIRTMRTGLGRFKAYITKKGRYD